MDNVLWSYDDAPEGGKSVFDSVRLGNLDLKNRLVRSATWEALAGEDGSLNDDIYRLYDELAAGGVGTIITGLTSVSDDDHVHPGIMRLSNDALIDDYKKLTDTVHSRGCSIFAQIALGDYIRDGSETPVDELTAADIDHIKELFADAAVRARKAGFDGVQLHAAHGYFLSRFYSPFHNHRDDLYGGTAGHRAKLILDILDAIKEREPELNVIAKLNFFDGVEGGVTLSDALTVCLLLADHGIDAIEVSGQNPSRKGIKIPYEEAYLKDYALALKSISDVPVILAGGNRSVESMEKVLNAESADFVSLSRPLIREPDLPVRWKEDPGYVSRCISCNACYLTPGHRCKFV